MKCVVFYYEDPQDAAVRYNEWAKDKQLAKDVIVHTHATRAPEEDIADLMIVVFFDEKIHPSW